MKTLLRVLAPIFAATLLLLGTDATASASAFGSAPVDSFSYEKAGVTVDVPTGCFLNHRVSGAGTTIDSENAGTDCVGPGLGGPGFCNWRIDFTYEDVEGRQYETNAGPINNACDHYTFRSIKTKHTLPSFGKACARLYVNGAERAVQCHNIVR